MCIIIGYKTTYKDGHPKILALPPDSKIVLGITDYDEWFIGVIVLDMGELGIDRCYQSFNPEIINNLKCLGLDSQLNIAEISTNYTIEDEETQ